MTHAACVLHGRAEQAVGERRLAGAARAEQHQGLPGAEPRRQLRSRIVLKGVDRNGVQPRRQA